MKLKQIKEQTTWREAVQAMNGNSQAIKIEFDKFLYGATNRGYFTSPDALTDAYPTANKGDIAFVYDSDGEQYLWRIYRWGENEWEDTGDYVPIEIDLSGDLNISSLYVDNEIHSNGYIKSDSQIESSDGFVIIDKTNEDVLLAGGGTKPLSELGKLSTTDTTDTNDYEDVF